MSRAQARLVLTNADSRASLRLMAQNLYGIYILNTVMAMALENNKSRFQGWLEKWKEDEWLKKKKILIKGKMVAGRRLRWSQGPREKQVEGEVLGGKRAGTSRFCLNTKIMFKRQGHQQLRRYLCAS